MKREADLANACSREMMLAELAAATAKRRERSAMVIAALCGVGIGIAVLLFQAMTGVS